MECFASSVLAFACPNIIAVLDEKPDDSKRAKSRGFEIRGARDRV
jgi:hypothetical protein